MEWMWAGLEASGNVIKQVLMGVVPSCQKTGGAILVILLAIELFAEAMDLSAGRGFKLDKRLIKWAICAVAIASYIKVADGIWVAAMSVTKNAVSEFNVFQTTALDANKVAMQAMMVSMGSLGWLAILKYIPMLIGFVLGLVVIMILVVIVYVMLLAGIAAFGMVVTLGPIFIPFLLNDYTRGMFIKWLSSMLGFFLMLPMLGWAMTITNSLFFNAIKHLTFEANGLASLSHLMTLFLGPLTGIGILMHVPRVVQSLMGGAGGGGGGEAMAGGMAAGRMLSMGRSLAGGGGGGGGAAAAAATTAAKTATEAASSSAKAAQG